jgi:Protein of unknown function (DUF3617)
VKVPAVYLHRILFLQPAAVALLLCLSARAFAAELPPLRKGMWEFNRTVEGQGPGGKAATMTNKKCTDPSADMKRMTDLLSKQGCKFSAPSAKANVYSFSSECQVQGVAMQSQSVITVESDSSYTVQVSANGGGRSTKELLVAKRVGDC